MLTSTPWPFSARERRGRRSSRLRRAYGAPGRVLSQVKWLARADDRTCCPQRRENHATRYRIQGRGHSYERTASNRHARRVSEHDDHEAPVHMRQYSQRIMQVTILSATRSHSAYKLRRSGGLGEAPLSAVFPVMKNKARTRGENALRRPLRTVSLGRHLVLQLRAAGPAIWPQRGASQSRPRAPAPSRVSRRPLRHTRGANVAGAPLAQLAFRTFTLRSWLFLRLLTRASRKASTAASCAYAAGPPRAGSGGNTSPSKYASNTPGCT